ncbi:uncharacterized protein A1O9_03877 [Exophiala aquamarina CBS 119918]|uniref:Uncharacterized protein n=1 Tax=Exophiala aquamarina CBS 119918 TaxID=1182545 RepID=A0A072PFX6_9EURO|nr:uncharacterized protein A1O9_03877 [Exophiala aquamarina CBS 119918]KEF59034.1 hypothetical protein A1O9_03877 [Exophiala aquamarina CBS 119918]
MPIENDDPGINALCAQTLLSQFHRLRPLTQHICDAPLAQSTRVSPLTYGTTQFTLKQLDEGVNQRYRHMQDSMLWLGILCDMSQSAIQKCPSVLLPGNSGDEKAWDFIRQRTDIFERSFGVLNNSLTPLPEDVVVVLLQHASACKTMYFGCINQFRDSLSQHNLDLISVLAKKVSDERKRFHGAFDQLLTKCARDFLTMTLECQMNYVLLVTHQSLGSLILADLLDAVVDLKLPLQSPGSIRLQACSAVVHTLSLVANYDQYSSEDLAYGSRLLHDPLPELMVEVLSEAGKAIYSLVNNCELSEQSARVMLAVLSSALRTLSQISKTAGYALLSFEHIERTCQFKLQSGSSTSRASTPWITSGKNPVWDGNIAHYFLHEMETGETFDSSSLEAIIQEHVSSDFRDFDSSSSFTHPTTSEGSMFSYHLSPDSSNSCDQ